jgi:hypothetical protein
MSEPKQQDPDAGKGAFEPERPGERGNTSLRGQMPHRNPDPLAEGQDTDFPEPGNNAEHSGEPEDPESNSGSERSGQRQRRNQGDKKDDPLAA